MVVETEEDLGRPRASQSPRTEEMVIGMSCEERIVAKKVREVFISYTWEEGRQLLVGLGVSHSQWFQQPERQW